MTPFPADRGPAPQPRTTRRRGSCLTRAIYRTVLAELADHGFDTLSFDKIAAGAGTGKASLYRRCSTPAELVLDAMTDPIVGFDEVQKPFTGSVLADLIVLLDGFARTVELQPRGRALLPLMTQRQRHPELYRNVRRLIIEPRRQQITDIRRNAAERGEIVAGAVTPLVAATGPRLVIAGVMDHDTVSTTEIEAVVDEVLLPFLTGPRVDPGGTGNRDNGRITVNNIVS